MESYRVNEALKQQKKMAKEEKDKALKKHLKQKVRKDLKKIDMRIDYWRDKISKLA